MKTCLEVACIALATMGVIYIIDNKKKIKNTLIKPITNMMGSNN